MEDPRILQITPADGWVAIFEGDEGEELALPLACFALVEFEEDDDTWTEVRAMTVEERAVVFCDEIENFVRIDRIETLEDFEDDAE